MAEMTDKSVMPFGKYKGLKLEEVPAHYLLWLESEAKPGKFMDLMAYIKKNKNLLEQELEEKRGWQR